MSWSQVATPLRLAVWALAGFAYHDPGRCRQTDQNHPADTQESLCVPRFSTLKIPFLCQVSGPPHLGTDTPPPRWHEQSGGKRANCAISTTV